jgi:hypothetical protein
MRKALAICLLMGLLGSCGGMDAADAPLEVSTCQDNWSVMLQASSNVWDIETSLNGSGLSWSNGQLYFEYWDKAATSKWAIASIPTSTSAHQYTNVVNFDAPYWWIENDQLIYLADNAAIYGVPLDGSAQPTQLLNLAHGSSNTQFSNYILDSEALYWVGLEHDTSSAAPSGWSVWRALRASGELQQLAVMPVAGAYPGLESTLTLTQDSVVVLDGTPGLSTDNRLYVVPKTGGSPRELPKPSSGWLLATNADGVSLWLESVSGGKSYRMWRSTMDGAVPTPFWTDKPPSLFLTQAWSDGTGGWYLAAWEYTHGELAPDSQHTSIWSLDSSGHGVRVACNPLSGSTNGLATAVSPTAFFLLDRDETWGDTSGQTQSILSITR